MRGRRPSMIGGSSLVAVAFVLLAGFTDLRAYVVAMVLFGHAVQRVGPVRAGIFTHLVPVFGAFFAALLVGEALQPYHGLGFLLVAGGAIVSCLPAERVLSSRPPPRG